jgi:putative toxin-antitoxin system antitoxin component (TIGR02293 family)
MKYAAIVESLGGEKVVGYPLQSELDLVNLVRRGLTRGALFHLSNSLRLSLAEAADIFHVSLRTLQRYKQKGDSGGEVLDSAVSDRMVQLADLYAYGSDVLGESIFIKWLQTPLRTLGGKMPKELLFSSVGIEMVKDELTRMEYGVYS